MTNIVTLAPQTTKEIADDINEQVAEVMRDWGMLRERLIEIAGGRAYATLPIPGFHRLSGDLFYALAKPGTIKELTSRGERFMIGMGENDLALYSDEAVPDHDLRLETAPGENVMYDIDDRRTFAMFRNPDRLDWRTVTILPNSTYNVAWGYKEVIG